MKQALLTAGILIAVVQTVDSQCYVHASANYFNIDTIELCIEDSLLLTSAGNCNGYYLWQNNFNNATMGSGWDGSTTPMFNNPCGPGFDGSTYCWVGAGSCFPRILQTVPFSITSQEHLCFSLRMAKQGDSSPCEGPDEMDEGLSIQYSTDGANWNDMAYFAPDQHLYAANSWIGTSVPGESLLSPFIYWNHYCFQLPSAAVSTSTSLRWYQAQVSSQVFDHWGIDDVSLAYTSDYDVVWQGPNGFSWNGFNPPVVTNHFSGWYTVTLTDGTNSASDSIFVKWYQTPDTNFTVSSPVCVNDLATVQLTGAVLPGANYTWNFGSGAIIVSGSGAGPYLVYWNSQGVKTISLTIIDSSGGCSTSSHRYTQVLPAGTPNCCIVPTTFAGVDDHICGSTYQMNPVPTQPGNTVLWSQISGPGSSVFSAPNSGQTTVTVSASGSYLYSLLEISGLCQQADTIRIDFYDSIYVNAGPDQYICLGDTIVLQANGGSNWFWTPGNFLGQSYTVSPNSTTGYHVSVNDGNLCSATDHVTINVAPYPIAGFIPNINGASVTFVNNSSGLGTCIWDFGDGFGSTQTNPVHSYATTGSYPVTLIVTNSCSSDTNIQTVSVIISSVSGVSKNIWTVFPNPASEFISIRPDRAVNYTGEVFSVDGRVIKAFIAQGEERLNVEGLKPGLYFLKISTKDGERLQFPLVILDSQ